MRVKLKVLDGKNSGKEIKLPRGKFLIGRHEECDLRPSSDSVSRRHCVITVKDGEVYIRDLNSRNGTVVNGNKITDKTFLKMGDDLQVGRLKFELVVDHGIGGEKKATVANVKEAMARTAESKPKAESKPEAESKPKAASKPKPEPKPKPVNEAGGGNGSDAPPVPHGSKLLSDAQTPRPRATAASARNATSPTPA